MCPTILDKDTSREKRAISQKGDCQQIRFHGNIPEEKCIRSGHSPLSQLETPQYACKPVAAVADPHRVDSEKDDVFGVEPRVHSSDIAERRDEQRLQRIVAAAFVAVGRTAARRRETRGPHQRQLIDP